MITKIFFIIFILLIFAAVLVLQTNELQRGFYPPVLIYKSFASKGTKILNWKDVKGETVLIDFWATWCSPCIKTIPHLNNLVSKYKSQKVKFLSLTYETEELVRQFIIQHPMKSEIGIDTGFINFRNFSGWAIPNIVMINSKGLFAGRIHPADLNEKVINSLIAGEIPDVKNTPDNLYNPKQAEDYFRSLLNKQKK